LLTERDPATILAMTDENSRASRLSGIGVDWWATIIAGLIALLAVADILPKIPW
jgi:hypothetical protein